MNRVLKSVLSTPSILSNVLISICALLFFGICLTFVDWGYDEYGAVVSHLELNDPRFRHVYSEILTSYGFPQYIIENILLPILSLIIVPLRWTYALGISPLYSVIRLEALSWADAKIVLHAAHVLCCLIGMKLIFQSIPARQVSTIAPIFLSCILLSSPFVYWITTFTSYSYHLLCFGLLLFGETRKDLDRNLYFGSISVTRVLVVLFNYQYIFALVGIGALELASKKTKFFSGGAYRGWIPVALLIIFSMLLIYLRLNSSGTVVSPQFNFNSAQQFLIDYSVGAVNIFYFISTRTVDILIYFFTVSSGREYFMLPNIGRLSPFEYSFFFLSFAALTILCWRIVKALAVDRGILRVCIALILCQLALYFFRIQPMSPTRHSLILFLPLALLLSFMITGLFRGVIEGEKLLSRLSLVVFFVIIFVSWSRFLPNRIDTNSPISIVCLAESRINTVVLESCFLEPILENKANQNINFLYSCGPYVIDKVSASTDKLALLSYSSLNRDQRLNELGKYSEATWSKDSNASSEIGACIGNSQLLEKGNINIYQRVEDDNVH
jgi:hypothetical protein